MLFTDNDHKLTYVMNTLREIRTEAEEKRNFSEANLLEHLIDFLDEVHADIFLRGDKQKLKAICLKMIGCDYEWQYEMALKTEQDKKGGEKDE